MKKTYKTAATKAEEENKKFCKPSSLRGKILIVFFNFFFHFTGPSFNAQCIGTDN
jgi:hypothetical protein